MAKKTRRRLIVLTVLGLAAAVALADRLLHGGPPPAGDGVFEVKPYLQWGDDPEGAGLSVAWQSADRGEGAGATWAVDTRPASGGAWAAAPPTSKRVDFAGVSPFRLWRAGLAVAGRDPSADVEYRVTRGGVEAFRAVARGRKPEGSPHRFVAFGDCAAGGAGQWGVAYQAALARPDYAVITGDVVYMRGRVSEYVARFFPVYNSDEARPGWGGPLLRSVPFLAAAGNHDLIDRDLDRLPDGLAYFLYWSPPLNGPEPPPNGANTPTLKGAPDRRKAFLDAAGSAYPRAANFAFDYGDAHWTVLDANTYADWTDPALVSWLEADLASPRARRAAWRFVAFHHAPFHASKAHAEDQRMRRVAPILEAAGVDLVFNGHVHNYQRTRPLRFAPEPVPPGGPPHGPAGQVEGRWTLDAAFDGATRTRPDGIIYVVTGAGGARLYDTGLGGDPSAWPAFTARVVSDVHSLTVVDVTPTALTVRQVDAGGAAVDRFVVSRDGPPTPRASPKLEAGAPDPVPEPGPDR